MKIIFEDFDKKKLEETKQLIEDILSANLEEMELNEENLKKAENIVSKNVEIKTKLLLWTSGQIKIVSSDGTELTRMF